MWKRNQMNGRGLVAGVSVFVFLMFMLTSVPVNAAAGSGWETATLIETDNQGSAYNPRVGVDAAGNVIAVWQQYFTVGLNTYVGIWANRYVVGFGWGDAKWIAGTYNVGDGSAYIDLAVSSNGSAMAVWTDGGNVLSSLYQPNSGWRQWGYVENLASWCRAPHVAMDDEGNAVFVWKAGASSVAAMTDVYANWAFGGVVDPTQRVVIDNAASVTTVYADPSDVVVAVGDLRNATVVWSQWSTVTPSGEYNMYANRYHNGIWEGQATVEYQDGVARYPDVAMDKSNNAIAVWCQEVAGNINIYSNVYRTSAAAWYTESQGVDLLENENPGAASHPRVAMDAGGNAITVWDQVRGAVRNVRANQYVKDARWDAANAIDINSYATDSFNPDVAMDAAGDVVVVWSQVLAGTSVYDAWERVFRVGVGWTASDYLEDLRVVGVQSPRVAMNAGGYGMAVWYDTDGFRWNIYANRVVLPDLIAPSLSLTSPTNGLVTTIPVVTVAGTVEANVMLVVNGISVGTSAGAFSVNMALQAGDNTITVRATDAGGNSATETRTVRFNDPIPTLQAQVAQIVSDLATVWSKLNYTNATVGTVWDQLNTTQTSLTALQAQVSALRSQLTTAYAGLNSTQTQVTTALSDIDALQALLDALGDQLDATRTALNTTQNDLSGVQDDLETTQGDLNGKAESSSPMMWAVIAILVSVVAAVALNLVLKKKT